MAETVLVCECGCGQSEHHVGRKGCKHCPDCKRFRAAEEVPVASLTAAVEPVPAEELAAVAELTTAVVGNHAIEIESADTDALAASALVELVDVRRELDDLTALHEATVGELASVGRERDRLRSANTTLGEQLTEANGRIRELACEVEQLGAQLQQAERYARDLQDNGDAQMTIDHLLDQADATGDPAVIKTSTTIRGLLTRLREQLAEHDRLEGLRARERELIAELADIQRQLGKEPAATPADMVPDKVIRVWARENGFEVPARGGVPLGVRAAYLQANPA